MRAALASLAVLSLCACGPHLTVVGDGVAKTVDRPVEGTKAVRMELPATLTLIIGSPASLRMTGEDNLFQYIDTTVSGGELVIGVEPNVSLSPTVPMEFVLTAPSFRSLTAASPGNIIAPALTAPDFRLRVQSRGNIHLARLDATTLDAVLDSSGDVQIDEGKVSDQAISIRSSGNFVAGNLESASARVHVSSSGSAWLWVTGRLTVTITSSGNVRYAGLPQVISNVTGSGTASPISE